MIKRARLAFARWWNNSRNYLVPWVKRRAKFYKRKMERFFWDVRSDLNFYYCRYFRYKFIEKYPLNYVNLILKLYCGMN